MKELHSLENTREVQTSSQALSSEGQDTDHAEWQSYRTYLHKGSHEIEVACLTSLLFFASDSLGELQPSRDQSS